MGLLSSKIRMFILFEFLHEKGSNFYHERNKGAVWHEIRNVRMMIWMALNSRKQSHSLFTVFIETPFAIPRFVVDKFRYPESMNEINCRRSTFTSHVIVDN